MRIPYKHLLEQPEYNPDIVSRLSSYMESINAEKNSCLRLQIEVVPAIHRVVVALLESIDLAFRDNSVNYFWIRKEDYYEIIFFSSDSYDSNFLEIGGSWISLLGKYTKVTGDYFFPNAPDHSSYFEWASAIALDISKDVTSSHQEWFGLREKEEEFI